MKKIAEQTNNSPSTSISWNIIHTPDNYLSNDDNLKKVFDLISQRYGKDIAANVERVYRLETGHFKSLQYKNTGSAGMLAFDDTYPYGWKSLKPFWDSNKDIAPTGIGYNFLNYKYLAFPNYGGFFALAEILKARGNNPGKWYSTDAQEIAEYNEKINKINTQFV